MTRSWGTSARWAATLACCTGGGLLVGLAGGAVRLGEECCSSGCTGLLASQATCMSPVCLSRAVA